MAVGQAADTTAAAINGPHVLGEPEGMRFQHTFGFLFDAISLHDILTGIVLLRSSPCAMSFTHLLATLRVGNHPFHIFWDCDDSEARGMPIGCLPKFLHHANEVLIIPWNEFPSLVQARFPRPRSHRPIDSRILFVQRFPLPQFTQPNQCPVAYAEFAVAPVDHDSLHGRSLAVAAVSHHRMTSIYTAGVSSL